MPDRLRLGYLGAPRRSRRRSDAIQSHSTSNPCSFAQKGAFAALKGDQQPVADMREEFNLRRNYMINRIKCDPAGERGESGGCVLRARECRAARAELDELRDRLLSKHHVAVVPGIAFGNDNTVRLSYATSLDIIKKASIVRGVCKTL